ncbi:hypothetical protein JI721_03085 [Alicyclobacillus cycloheptanicus]|uniref:Uncharacterized protein n=1 Tax=Alicyclobacillus cycloheptanicus TaxID=1457 RepID=A0ABT9XK43_9BACL|nr:hypothetical protein [Alicyclobacillus cycloheptanicus]MDQ0190648.1 hypothetical protein [Alicyclobacillus cycloheptanicus]WDM01846.1 hypothetical protein JI721_03085 [Alicyclobacillus cycloheptanicus]
MQVKTYYENGLPSQGMRRAKADKQVALGKGAYHPFSNVLEALADTIKTEERNAQKLVQSVREVGDENPCLSGSLLKQQTISLERAHRRLIDSLEELLRSYQYDSMAGLSDEQVLLLNYPSYDLGVLSHYLRVQRHRMECRQEVGAVLSQSVQAVGPAALAGREQEAQFSACNAAVDDNTWHGIEAYHKALKASKKTKAVAATTAR